LSANYFKAKMYESERKHFLINLISPLYLISLMHGLVVSLRRVLYRLGIFKSGRIGAYVISVGNIVVGGSGKTPTVIYVAKLLQNAGYKVCILSRGYRGANTKEYLEVSDESGILSDPTTAGDEPYMMACELIGIPVIVGRNRYKSGLRAVKKFKPDVCILDDGFQHIKLKRDLNIVTFDGETGIGNGHLIPRGFLREQVSALKRADIVLINKGAKSIDGVLRSVHKYMGDTPNIFCGSYVPSGLTSRTGAKEMLNKIANKRIFCFSALANADYFHQLIENAGGMISGTVEYGDHHDYTRDDYNNIIKNATASGADFIITTKKDIIKFDSSWGEAHDLKIFSLDIDLEPVTLKK